MKTTSYERFLLRLLDWATDPDPAPNGHEMCECGHDPVEEHRRGGGACRALDGYGLPCACTSVEIHADPPLPDLEDLDD